MTPDPTETLIKEEQRGVGSQKAILGASGLWKIPGPERGAGCAKPWRRVAPFPSDPQKVFLSPHLLPSNSFSKSSQKEL